MALLPSLWSKKGRPGMRLVDADKLKERLMGDFPCDTLLLDKIIEAVDDEETIEQPQGEWEERIVNCNNLWLRRRFYCSNCGDWQTYGITRYCSQCGAKMKGV